MDDFGGGDYIGLGPAGRDGIVGGGSEEMTGKGRSWGKGGGKGSVAGKGGGAGEVLHQGGRGGEGIMLRTRR